MAEGLNGTLSFNSKGQRLLVFTTPKGGQMTVVLPSTLLSPKVQANKDAIVQVKVNTGSDGRPTAVHLEGEKFSAPIGAVQPGAGQQITNGDFHNPYNFVPVPPRITTGELGDREPAGHDRYYADKYSGKLSVKMTVETPLLLPDTARMTYTDDDEKGITEHKSYPVRVDASGEPHINPTAVKGMLRSAYEAITNSRLSVFKDHDERLAYRGEATTRSAARIELYKGSLHIRKFVVLPAVLVRYRKHWSGERDKLAEDDASRTPVQPGRAMSFAGTNVLPKHGQAVWVRVSNRVAHAGYRAGHIIGTKVNEIRVRNGGTAPAGFIKGWACVTGANAKDKVYERVFVESAGDRHIPLTDDHKRMWKELITNYQITHKEEIKKRRTRGQEPTDYLGDDPGKTAFSVQIHDHHYARLEDGTLCYLIEEGHVIKAIVPVIISRQLHEVPPDSLLSDSLKPVSLIEDVRNARGEISYSSEMSPGERLFGCIRQKRKDKNGKDKNFSGTVAAYRGQVRIGTITCRGIKEESQDGTDAHKADVIQLFGGEQNPDSWLPLNILGQPKPQQGRFYVAKNQQCDAQDPGQTNVKAGYSAAKSLRGRKVYPHHNLSDQISTEYWKNSLSAELKSELTTYYREFRRPQRFNRETKKMEDQRDSQNRSVSGWVKPQTEFAFDIHFINLSLVELGALIWLLTLQDGYHRFGGGKPFGFGSVKLELDSDKGEILKGSELRKKYLAVDLENVPDVPQPTKPSDCLSAFDAAINNYPNGRLMIESFLAAARGFVKPVHYPRTSVAPNPEGESFKWFVENNRNDGLKTTLPNLRSETGLPLMPKK